MSKTLKVMFEALFPEGAAWHPEIDGDFDHFLDGLGDNAEVARAYLAGLADVRSPLRTTDLPDLEIEFGIIPNDNISDSARRGYLAGKKHNSNGTGSVGTGVDHLGNIQTKLREAGFNVYVYANDPPIDPDLFLDTIPHAWCGKTEAVCGNDSAICGGGGKELLANSALEDSPYVYVVPDQPDRWPFIFFIGGERTGWIPLKDWNMEKSGTIDWTPGGSAVLSKSMVVKNSPQRSLRIAGNGDVDLQQQQPGNPDADLDGFYRMDDVGAGVVENLAWKNELVDGNMEKPGTDVIVDGDMETTGPDVIVDGDMEAVGVAAWTVSGNSVLTKQGSPHTGTQCLRVAFGGPSTTPAARQTITTIGKTYRVKGWARSNGTRTPYVFDGGNLWAGTTSTSWQAFDFVYVATAVNLYFLTYSAGAGDYVEFDDITVIDETVACVAWVASNAILSKQEDAYEAAQCLRAQQTIALTSALAFQVVLTIGKTYRVKGWARSDGILQPNVRDSGGGFSWIGTTSTSWQEFDVVWVAVGTGAQFRSLNGAGGIGDYVEFDDVYVIDLDAGASDYTTIGTVTATKREDPYDGQRCLRVTNGAGVGIVKPTVDVLVIGNDFHITGYARGSGTAVPRLRDGAGAYIFTGTSSTDWQEIDISITATAVDLRFMASLINDYAEFDQMMVNAIPFTVPTLGTDASNANGVNVVTPWLKGIEFVPGAAAVLDAGAVNLPMASENMTMIGWFYLEDHTTPAIQGLITNGGVGVTRQGLYIDGGFLRYSCVSGTAQIIQTAITLPYQQRWRVRIGVTRTFDGAETTEKLFVNGILKDELTFRGAPDVTLTQCWIGWLNAVNYFNGVGSDNVSMFNSGKSDAYMLADYEDGIEAMLAGSYAEQVLDTPITVETPLTGYAWGDLGAALPFVLVLDAITGEWRTYWMGVTGAAKQDITATLANIAAIRMYLKGADTGEVYFDDMSIIDPNIVPAIVPANKEDTFKKIILECKPMRSWAALIVEYS